MSACMCARVCAGDREQIRLVLERHTDALILDRYAHDHVSDRMRQGRVHVQVQMRRPLGVVLQLQRTQERSAQL